MHQQKEHNRKGNEANIEELLKIGMMVAEAQMKEIVDEAPNKDRSTMVPTVKQHITTATQMEEGNSKQGQMVRFVKVDTSNCQVTEHGRDCMVRLAEGELGSSTATALPATSPDGTGGWLTAPM